MRGTNIPTDSHTTPPQEWRGDIHGLSTPSPAISIKAFLPTDTTEDLKTKGVDDIEERIKRLEAYEKWGKPTKVDFE